MARKQSQAFYEFHEQAITPLKNRVTNLENKSGVSSDTTVVTVSGGSGGFAFSYGDTQPVVKSLWLDTSEFVSIQGETPTQTIFLENAEDMLIVSDTQPDKNDCLWLDTSEGE